MNVKIITRSYLSQRKTSPKALCDRLAARLFTYGGEKLVWQGDDPHAQELLEHGKLWSLPVKFRKGQRSRCHGNAAAIWAQGPQLYRLITGYGLSDDGMWRCHSWVADDRWLYETTVRRELYFGSALPDLEAAKFWWANYLVQQHYEPLKILGLLGPTSDGCSCDVCRAEHGGAAA